MTRTGLCRWAISVSFLGILVTATASPLSAGADVVLVEDGQPRAAIVVAESPLRTVRLAAQELQDEVKKISGAHLPLECELSPG